MPSRSSPEDGAPAPCRWAPCGASRYQYAPTPLLILVVIALNYIPAVLFTLDRGSDGGRTTLVVIFHIFLGLTIWAWCFTCFVDPGVPPETWQRQMAARAAKGEPVQVCRRSGLYKPPRSHFDSVTQRLTLNMDHFCPWVRIRPCAPPPSTLRVLGPHLDPTQMRQILLS